MAALQETDGYTTRRLNWTQGFYDFYAL